MNADQPHRELPGHESNDVNVNDADPAGSPIGEYVGLPPWSRSPADARLRESGVELWALIGHYQMVGGDIDRVAYFYDVPVDAVRAAVAYYLQHRALIDARVLLNSV